MSGRRRSVHARSLARYTRGLRTLLVAAKATTPPLARADVPVFERDVRLVLFAKCGAFCGKDARDANFDMRTRSAIGSGGDSEPPISASDADASLRLARVTYLFEVRERRLTDVGGQNDLSRRLVG